MIDFLAMKRLLGKLALDLLGCCVVGGLLMLIFPIAVGIGVGLIAFVVVARPSIMEYRERDSVASA